MTPFTDEERRQLIQFYERDIRHPPRKWAWVELVDWQEICQNALLGCLYPEATPLQCRPQCRRKQTPGIERLWRTQRRQAYKTFKRHRCDAKWTVTLDDTLLETMGSPIDMTLESTIADQRHRELYLAFNEVERGIAELSADDLSAKEINLQTGATLHAIKTVRKKLVEVCRQSGEMDVSPWLAQGCRRAAYTDCDSASDSLSPIDRSIEALSHGSLEGWNPDFTPEERAKDQQEIRDAIRNIEARKAQLAAPKRSKVGGLEPVGLTEIEATTAANDENAEAASCGRAA